MLGTRVGIAFRRAVTDAWWELRGLTMQNRPLPADPLSLLFVCKGNICRSPFAAALAARLLGQEGDRRLRCSSAGFQASPGNRAPDHAVTAAARHGVTLASHRSVRLTGELVAASDVLVVMEHTHLALLRRDYPACRDRLVLLPLFAPVSKHRTGYLRHNIPDPYGKPLPAFEECYAHTRAAVQGLVAALVPVHIDRANFIS